MEVKHVRRLWLRLFVAVSVSNLLLSTLVAGHISHISEPFSDWHQWTDALKRTFVGALVVFLAISAFLVLLYFRYIRLAFIDHASASGKVLLAITTASLSLIPFAVGQGIMVGRHYVDFLNGGPPWLWSSVFSTIGSPLWLLVTASLIVGWSIWLYMKSKPRLQ